MLGPRESPGVEKEHDEVIVLNPRVTTDCLTLTPRPVVEGQLARHIWFIEGCDSASALWTRQNVQSDGLFPTTSVDDSRPDASIDSEKYQALLECGLGVS